ncbi:teichoic acid synthase [Arthrobacter crystallopoietes BAB-32]|uniref:Teichoic acid synthase n=2 Tax=Crystallibacter crystallopoietes TaxID=37928 RepID=N1VBQ0_9MICC|nr:teichoic acid synthase [Arthrobacter crystallopoietes BAB-32]
MENLVVKAKKAVATELSARARRQPIRRGTVLYESFSGNGMLCNPEAVFQSLLDNPEYAHLQHIWVLSSLQDYEGTIKRYAGNRNVRFVRYGSTEYYDALATSEYLFNNATFPWQFSKRRGQTYINTWHGTPLKKMGYHIEGGGPDTRNIIRNFVQADYLVSANSFMTEQMYLDGYKLRNLYRGKILETGYPRIDRQNLSETQKVGLYEVLSQHGIHDDGREVILYAPTWKGDSFYEPSNDAAILHRTIVDLEKKIDTTRYRILLKIHQVVYKAASKNRDLAGYLVPNDIPTNTILGITDILVTDYSSIFYDFLATGRPVLFHIPDLNRYSANRGLYVQPEQLPGPLSTDSDELASSISRLGAGEASGDEGHVDEKYEKARRDYTSLEDGSSTERLINAVFKNDRSMPGIRSDHGDGRERILLYLGGMASNGITTSALNLLDNIDYSRFDVSVLYSYSRNAAKMANADRINRNVRLFPRQGYPNVGLKDRQKYRAMLKGGLPDGVDFTSSAQPIWDDEWYRCFGDSEFDYIVDFSGYGPFWTYLLLRGNAKQHSIWLHNDLKKDAERQVNGAKPLKANLEAVFSTYKYFDKLVSVSEELSRLNEEHLSEFASAGKFTSAVNTVNEFKIKALTSPKYTRVADLPGRAACTADALPEMLAFLRSAYSAEDIAAEATRQAWLEEFFPAGTAAQTFVSVGRLSPEKNHARLIEAFSTVHLANPATRLLIIGNGPLKRQLESTAAEFGVSDAVVFAGEQDNPYALMDASDCFVLSSDYEGQPMVLLEAKVLGLPIVTTAFGSVASAVPPGTGLVVERSTKALARGMQDFLEGKVPASEFDITSYNNRAMQSFYEAIGASARTEPLAQAQEPEAAVGVLS